MVLGSAVLGLMTVFAALVLGALFTSAAGAQPAERSTAVLAGTELTCVSDGPAAGRLDIAITNPTDQVVDVIVGVDSVTRAVAVAPDSTDTTTVTGRRDGLRSITFDGHEVGEVLVRCSPTRPNDLAADAANPYVGYSNAGSFLRLFAWGDETPTGATLSPGEPSTCLGQREPGAGSVWWRIVAPGQSLSFPEGFGTIAAYVAADGSDQITGLSDLDPVACTTDAETSILQTTPGVTYWLQRSADRSAEARLPIEPLEPELDIAVSYRCFSGKGQVEIAITNAADVDAVANLQIESRASNRWQTIGLVNRSVAIEAGTTAITRVSARPDGLLLITAAPRIRVESWVKCDPAAVPTAPNDLLVNAQHIDLAADPVQWVTAPEGTHGHDPDEIEGPCIDVARGSAWYRFVAPTERITFGGGDDTQLALFASTTDSPTTMADLELLACGEPEDHPHSIVVPGQTYWVAMSDEPYQSFSINAAATPVSDTLATARELGAQVFDTVPNVAARTEDGEDVSCHSSWDEGTLWWKWTADGPVADLRHIADDGVSQGFGYGSFAIFSSSAVEPTLADLTLVRCGRDRSLIGVTPGQTYWIQYASPHSGATTISVKPITDAVTVTSRCVGDRGRIDVAFINPTGGPIQGNVALSSNGRRLLNRTIAAAAPGEAAAAAITGRVDGNYSVRITVGTFALYEQVIVDCAPRVDAFSVEVSCIAGRGRLDVVIPSTGSGAYTITASLAPSQITRTIYTRGTSASVVTITGRLDGDWAIEIGNRDGVLWTTTAAIGCSPAALAAGIITEPAESAEAVAAIT